eukprot:2426726-Alexandrium_andersonii.AAC.1
MCIRDSCLLLCSRCQARRAGRRAPLTGEWADGRTSGRPDGWMGEPRDGHSALGRGSDGSRRQA